MNVGAGNGGVPGAMNAGAPPAPDRTRQIEARRGRVACSGGCRPGVPGEACEGAETSDRRRTRSRLRDGAGAGDSAKVAAEADAGLSSDDRESVLAAHLAI